MLEFFRQIDWRIALMLGPRHRFSEAQWLRFAPLTAISPSVKMAALINAVFLSWVMSRGTPEGLRLPTALALLGLSVVMLCLAAAVWRRPTMRRLYLCYAFTVFPMGMATGFMMAMLRDGPDSRLLIEPLLMRGVALGLLFSFGIWVVAMWRNEYLADWLRDEELREHSAELTRRLSSAQIQPHFLFNSLASLQHWVATKDDRAAPLLQSLTGYLRATLPLFDRELLAVGEEAEAVQRYLEVMQARLGERLRFSLDVAPAAAGAQLPPGVLLTLVENAVEHGVQARLSDGEVLLRARLAGDGGLQVEIADNGPGLGAAPAAAAVGAAASLGLSNTRLRLAQAFGERASLSLSNRPEGGCLAALSVAPAAPHP